MTPGRYVGDEQEPGWFDTSRVLAFWDHRIMNPNLGPQFVFHGTAHEIEGSRLVPASEHGKGSYWGDTNSSRGEGAQDHAWAHPSEDVAWDAADDRANWSGVAGVGTGRARVLALHPNKDMTPGTDKSMAGELKAPHFDIAHQIDIKPGRQGTFPDIDWEEHMPTVVGNSNANHPTDTEIQYGHRAAGKAFNDRDNALGRIQDEAHDEGARRRLERAGAVGAGAYQKDEALPGFTQRGTLVGPKQLKR